MSLLHSQVDFLSECPCLSDILTFVSYEDIQNCKLVNYSINDVIVKNSFKLPRRHVNIIIGTYKEEVTQAEYARFDLYNYRFCVVYLTPSHTIIMAGHSRLLQQYAKYAVPCPYPDDSLGSSIMDYIRKRASEVVFEGTKFYHNDSFEDGLRRLMTYLFRIYYCDNLCLESNRKAAKHPNKTDIVPQPWLGIISSTFRKSLYRCRFLDVPCLMPGLEELYRALELHYLEVESASTATGFLTNLLGVLKWNRPTKMVIHFYKFDSLEAVTDFLQVWETGMCSLNKVELVGRASSRYANDLLYLRWSPRAIQNMMRNMKNSIYILVEYPQSQRRKILIRRSVDDKELSLIVSTDHKCTLHIKEY